MDTTTGSRSPKNSRPSTRSPNSSKSTYAPSTRQNIKPIPSGDSSTSSAPSSDTSDSASRNTRRLIPILEAIQEAEFPDIDSMILAYYSCSFEKSSWPDMAQRASRARRLSKLLVELHDISDNWPKWQSRMFREGVMECASEFRVAKGSFNMALLTIWFGQTQDESAARSWKTQPKVSKPNQMARTPLHL